MALQGYINRASLKEINVADISASWGKRSGTFPMALQSALQAAGKAGKSWSDSGDCTLCKHVGCFCALCLCPASGSIRILGMQEQKRLFSKTSVVCGLKICS